MVVKKAGAEMTGGGVNSMTVTEVRPEASSISWPLSNTYQGRRGWDRIEVIRLYHIIVVIVIIIAYHSEHIM